MTKTKFLRRTWSRYVKLGRKRKKKQNWRKPRGRDNKMREKRRGYPAVVSIGYKKPREKKFPIIRNMNDLIKISGKEEIILGKMGRKKKIEIAKKSAEKGIKIRNINLKKITEKKENTNKETKK